MQPASQDALGLSPELLSHLDQLTLQTRRRAGGLGGGNRRSSRPGTSTEFADFRTYVPGDDYRRIDWNALARLDRLMLKVYMGEEDLCLHLWIDTSLSMEWGEPLKSRAARRIAGALAYVGLSSFDRVGGGGFAADIVARLPLVRGRAASPRVWRFLGELPHGGATDFGALREVGRLAAGASIVVSDFLEESSLENAVIALRRNRQEVVLLQVLAPDELAPTVTGDITLTDVESGARVDVTVTPAAMAGYLAALAEHGRRLSSLAAAHGAIYVQVSSAEPLERVLLGTLRRVGLLR